MVNNFRKLFSSYSSQYWLIVCGVLISSTGSSLIWPFQLVYISEKINLPLTTSATLISISSLIGMFVSFLGGSIADRFGRKTIMVIALGSHGAAYILMSQMNTFSGFILPMALIGAAMPFYAIGSDSMIADMIPPENRAGAYSTLRIVNNAGIAIGPALGGLLITRSYTLAFTCAAIAMFSYFTILILFSKETLKPSPAGEMPETLVQNIKGYKLVVKDRYFIRFIVAMATGMIAPLMMWTLLAVYTKTNFSLSEAHYAWLPITNALMCVFLQYFITRITRRYHPKSMIALGMAIYALGTGSVALMSSLFGFWLSMILLTFGELILVPTGTAFAANRAPSKLRGRYMSFYWLTWGIARACAPLVGGILNDAISPRAIWYGGLIIGIFSSIMLLIDAIKGDIPAHPKEI